MRYQGEPLDQVPVEEPEADAELRDHPLLERVVLGLEGAGLAIVVDAGEGAVQELVDLPHPAAIDVELLGQVVGAALLEEGLVLVYGALRPPVVAHVTNLLRRIFHFIDTVGVIFIRLWPCSATDPDRGWAAACA
jgi:hypothetical protein